MNIGGIGIGRPIAVTGTGSAQQVVPRDCIVLAMIANSGATAITLYDSANASNPGNGFVTVTTTTATFYVPLGVALVNGLVANISSGNTVTFIVV